jgi:hypothetical protein
MDIQITEIRSDDGWFYDVEELSNKRIILHDLRSPSENGWYSGAVVFGKAPLSEMPNKTDFFFQGVKYKPWTS